MTEENTVLLELEGGVALVTLNRPDQMNSISVALLDSLHGIFSELRFNEDLRAVIVTGAGDKAFCAGADLKERAGMTQAEVRRFIQTIRQTFTLVEECPVPVIAAVNGAAFGGGTELALASDIRIVSVTAKLGLTETSLAIIPGAGGTQRLPRIIGTARAKEMIFTAERIDAQKALSYGLANRVTKPADLLPEARAMAARIAENGPVAVRVAKRAIDKGMQTDIATAMVIETTCYDITIPTEDRVEGLTAFREKRKPAYKGR